MPEVAHFSALAPSFSFAELCHMASVTLPKHFDLLGEIDSVRKGVGSGLDPARRSELGQYFTPASIAGFMARMPESSRECIRLLDPGAGVGILTAAWVAEMCRQPNRPAEVVLTAYELDEGLLPALRRTMKACQKACAEVEVDCRIEVRHEDFIEAGVEALDGGLWADSNSQFDLAILNPPYKKFRTDSAPRLLLRRLGMETSNLYTAFLSVVIRLLADGGEFVAITPRSFCNGPYFRPFRAELLQSVSLKQIHVFESRGNAFREDQVLQENIILHARKGVPQQNSVVVSQSHDPDDTEIVVQKVPFERVVRPLDGESFIHVVPDADGHEIAAAMGSLPSTLADLGLTVSTGRVVDFRAREYLRADPGADTVPLLYASHFVNGHVQWPRLGAKKPNAIVRCDGTASLLVPSGVYVLVKRFSSKEERRRVVAAIFDPADVPCDEVGFENHLNYFHANGAPLPAYLAAGLAAFLNSSQLDTYFRQFNGHTQVNATDLRSLRYPSKESLSALGKRLSGRLATQSKIDSSVELLLEKATS